MQEKHGFIERKELPENPKFERAAKTYVAIVHFNIRPEWHKLSRDEQLEITRRHIEELRPFASRVARTHLMATGLGKYDTIELLEAEDLQAITEIVSSFKAGAKSQYMDLVESTVTIKGPSRLVRDVAAAEL